MTEAEKTTKAAPYGTRTADDLLREFVRLKAVLADEAVRGSIGSTVSGQGVYLGQYKPQDRDGNSLGKVFNVFAAPQDLPDTMKYVDAVKHIA